MTLSVPKQEEFEQIFTEVVKYVHLSLTFGWLSGQMKCSLDGMEQWLFIIDHKGGHRQVTGLQVAPPPKSIVSFGIEIEKLKECA